MFRTIMMITFMASVAGASAQRFNGVYVPTVDPAEHCGEFHYFYNAKTNALEKSISVAWHDDNGRVEKCVIQKDRELPAINQGSRPWSFDWGDGRATGTQTTVLQNDGKLVHTVRVGIFGARTLTTTYEISGNILKVTSCDQVVFGRSSERVYTYRKVK